MQPELFPEDPSLRLAPGTQVNSWRVVDRQGHGAYGIVYRAHGITPEHSGPVAIKLARYPFDRRFVREAELLTRIHHPNVPRLHGQGLLRLPTGAEHPYLVMDWVEGAPLYDWARDHAPSPEQLCGIVAQLARALAATHAAGALHRDVKGSNVRVRSSDGRAFLIDFGSGYFQGATRLTWNTLPPGTTAYYSPEACLFVLRSVGSPNAWFEATAADDLFSLGVTAYRLVTGEYPPELEPQQDEAGAWHIERADPRPLIEGRAGLPPLLRDRILRLLSLAPEERGTAAELAEALERDVPRLSSPPAPAMREIPASAVTLPKQDMCREPARRWSSLQALAAAGLCGFLVWAVQKTDHQSESPSGDEHRALFSCASEAGTAAIGDSSHSDALASAHPPSDSEPDSIAQDPPPRLRPGQARPDEDGQCPGRAQVALNGACWVEHPSMTEEECADSDYAYIKGKCYTPAFNPPKKRRPTSSPGESP
jgi:serine/threonine protein kinase